VRGGGRRRVALVLATLCGASPAAAAELRDPYFGEALYYAYQERWFEALERLDTEIAQHRRVDEPRLDAFHHHIDHAEFSVGDFELHYRMHHRAGRAIRSVLEADVEDDVRNQAAYRLARIHFQKDQPEEALAVLDGMRGRVPEEIRDDVDFLRANVYLALGRPADAAAVLRGLQGAEELEGFSAYNLGIALLEDGRREEALEQLERAGRIRTGDRAARAIRDKSNLVRGTLLYEAADFGPAQRSLDRVRLQGPFSNQALLRAGWAAASAERFERALVPWGILAGREATDPAVQQAVLALPYAYSRLEVHGRAAVLYGRAVETFGREIEKLDASIRSVREGDFLKALVREEIRQDEDWVIHLRSLPDAPETFYLIELMASHDFQTGLQNHIDLEDLRKRLEAWRRSLDAFEDLVRLRRAYYDPLLPGIDERFRRLDSRMRLRLEQRRALEQRLQQMLVVPRPEHLATAEEQALQARIERLERRLASVGEAAAAPLRERIARLEGAIRWRLETRYHPRLTRAHEHLRELEDRVEELRKRHAAFVRTRQAATHSYVGYGEPIDRLRTRIRLALEHLDVLVARQGRMLERVASRELEIRRERLHGYLNQARFAFADSYDRAAQAQAQAQ